MKRRDFLLRTSAIAIGFPLCGAAKAPKVHGWIPSDSGIQADTCGFSGSEGRGKISLLWKKFHEPWTARKQLGSECVAQATGAALDLLTCAQGDRWVAPSSTDIIYAGARNHAVPQGTECPENGMRCDWGMTWLKHYGNLLRRQYSPYDLRESNARTLARWDKFGVPAILGEYAKKHPVLSFTQVKTWTDVCNALHQGYPVVHCTPMGADRSVRDSEGFMTPKGKWFHAWLIAGVDDAYDRPGALLINSHGTDWARGPKRHDQPDGSVWIDAAIIAKNCRNFGDSYAITGYKGYPKNKYRL